MLTFGAIKQHDSSHVKIHNFIPVSQSGLPTENLGSPWQFLVVYGLLGYR